MSRNHKIRLADRMKCRSVRIALKAFIAEPALGECQAKGLFTEILTRIKTGMDDEQIIQAVIEKHKTVATNLKNEVAHV